MLSNIHPSSNAHFAASSLTIFSFGKNTLLIYEGLCSPQEGVKISDVEISQVNEVPDNIHNDPIPGPICYDVIFIGDDVRCVPDPIKFECELNDDTDRGFLVIV
jgi:hypothetical protein